MPDALSLSLLLGAALTPTLIVAVLALHVNRRLMAENRELLKANLALSGKPEAAALAGAMESTDRIPIQAEAAARMPPTPQGQQRRLVGA